jgi:AraC-like DNA-binding protein
MCGFVSATHFSRCYRKIMGRAPKYERMAVFTPTRAEGLLTETMGSLSSSSLQALKRARTEPTYGTFENYPKQTVSG